MDQAARRIHNHDVIGRDSYPPFHGFTARRPYDTDPRTGRRRKKYDGTSQPKKTHTPTLPNSGKSPLERFRSGSQHCAR
jgi:hypothetical protein